MSVGFDPSFRDDVLDDELWNQAMIALALPAPGNYGRLHVVREAVQYIPLYGQQLMLSEPVHWTLVYEDATLWMSDTPQERLMMCKSTEGMYGHVLVAGGGLGMYPQYLRRYGRAERVTIVECNPDTVAALRTTLGADPAIEIVHAHIEQFMADVGDLRFDGGYIDIHPTIDPRWLPGLNWLRDRFVDLVSGPLRIWGYHWMCRELVTGLEEKYIPVLRRGLRYDDDLGRDLARALPAAWERWSDARLRTWLLEYAHQVAWPLEVLTPCAASIDHLEQL
jgi:hypothetical protein